MTLKERLAVIETGVELSEAAVKRSHPTGWEPGIVWDPSKGGTLTAGPFREDLDPGVWDELIADWGLNPETTEVVNGSVQIRGWDTNVGGGEIVRMKYYKATIRPRSQIGKSVDLEALYNETRKTKVKKGPKNKSGDATLLFSLSDWQCVDGTSIVLDRNGNACQIKDHPDAWFTGRKKSLRLQVEGSGVLHCTPDHQVWTLDGWVEAQNLQVGSLIGTLNEWDHWENIPAIQVSTATGRWQKGQDKVVALNPELGALLGYIASDGSMKQATHKFTNTNVSYINEVKDLSDRILGSQAVIAPHGGSGFTVHLTGNNGHPSKVLEEIGLWDEKFPTVIFRSSPLVAGSFLNRLWAGDGCITKRGRFNKVPSLELACGGSEVYANYALTLLAKLGIGSRITTENMKKSTQPFYRLVVNNGKQNVLKFFSIVGLIYGKEEASLSAVAYYDGKRENAIGVEPQIHDGETLRYRRVLSLESAGERDVYDMTVPEKHWFIANGIKVHNCGNPDFGGIEKLVEAVADLNESIPQRVADLRRQGYEIGTVCLAGMGDLIEGTCGFYPAQQYRVEIDRREQLKLVRRGLRDIILNTSPVVESLKVVAIGGNHGENRKDGKAFTTVGDNDDVAVFEQVAEIISANPDVNNVQWRIPGDEIAVTVELSGKRVAFTHGHVARGNGNAAEVMWTWWKNQSMGRAYPGVADADVLIAGHFHHLSIKEQEHRLVVVTPSLTNVSEYFANSAGVRTQPGTLSMLIRPDGWGELTVI